MVFTEQSAKFSERNIYRYELLRIWVQDLKTVMFIGLNPSKATDKVTDRTISTCINRAKAWGFGGIIMCNLFGLVSTDPKELLNSSDPIGVENDIYLKDNADKVDMIVAMWGDLGQLNGRSEVVKKLFLEKLFYLNLNKSGEPSHTRGLSLDFEPTPFK